jgi:hypothetical protein
LAAFSKQVGHHALEPPLVHADVEPGAHRAPITTVGMVPAPFAEAAHPGLDRPLHQLAHVDLLEEHVDRAGVGPGHLEQVADHALEPAQVVAEQLQGALGPGGRLSRSASSTSSEADRVVRGERSSWLTSELKRASRSMRLQLVDHGVERGGEALEVGIGRLGSSRVSSSASGDGHRRPRHAGQRAQRASAGEAAQRDAEQVVTTPVPMRVSPEHPQGVVQVGQREHLEVGGVHGRDGHPDTICGWPWGPAT